MRFLLSFIKVLKMPRLFRQDQDQDQDFFFKTKTKTNTFISRPRPRPRPFFMSSRRLETKTKVSRLHVWGRGSWVPAKHNVARAEAYLRAKFHQMKLGTQVGLSPGHVVFCGDPAPPRLKGHSLPPSTVGRIKMKFILIRPTVWPQCTNVTDRQTGQTTDRWVSYPG